MMRGGSVGCDDEHCRCNERIRALRDDLRQSEVKNERLRAVVEANARLRAIVLHVIERPDHAWAAVPDLQAALEVNADDVAAENERLRAVVEAAQEVDRNWSALDTLEHDELDGALNELYLALRSFNGF